MQPIIDRIERLNIEEEPQMQKAYIEQIYRIYEFDDGLYFPGLEIVEFTGSGDIDFEP